MQTLNFISAVPLPKHTSRIHRPLINTRCPTIKPCKPQRHNARINTKAALALPAAIPPAVATALTTAATAASPFAIWAVLIGAATFGLTSQKYRWGTALSPPVVSTLFTLILSNFSLMPVAHPIYSSVTSVFVPLAVPLILLGADLRRVFSQTGRLLPVFLTGTAATCIGTLVAWAVVPMKTIGACAWKIAAALTARHIGGAVNYIAVIEATGAPADMVAAALTADNVVVALYFILLLLLARNVSQPPVDSSIKPAIASSSADITDDMEDSSGRFTAADGGIAVAISAIMCTASAFISSLIPVSIGIIPMVTIVAVAMATLFPKQLAKYKHAASSIGMFFMQIFFAVSGTGGSLMSVLRRAPVLLLFSVVQLSVHLGLFLVAGRLFRFHRSEVLVASNANVGGPSTAAAMAGSKSWDRLVVPGLLVGVLGYSIGTFVSLAIGLLLRKF